MKKELAAFLEEIKHNDKVFSFDETSIKQAIVLHALHLLGWNSFDVEEVFPDYPVTRGTIDYALRSNLESKVFILVKRPNESLYRFSETFLAAAREAEVPIAILTNGVEWDFFLPNRKGRKTKKKFFSISIEHQDIDDMVDKFVNFLSKDKVLKGKSEEEADKVFRSRKKKRIIKEALLDIWNDFTTNEENKFALFLAAEAEKLCGYPTSTSDVHNFLKLVLKRGRGRRPALKLETTKKKNTKARKPRKKTTKQIETKTEATKTRKTRGRKKKTKSRSDKFKNFIGKKPKSFTFLGRKMPVKKWKEVLINVANLLSKARDEDFDKVLELKGRKRNYFSRNPEDLKEPRIVNGTDIYVETNFNASNLFMITLKLIKAFGYKEGDIKVETR